MARRRLYPSPKVLIFPSFGYKKLQPGLNLCIPKPPATIGAVAHRPHMEPHLHPSPAQIEHATSLLLSQRSFLAWLPPPPLAGAPPSRLSPPPARYSLWIAHYRPSQAQPEPPTGAHELPLPLPQPPPSSHGPSSPEFGRPPSPHRRP